jgi:predicted alpha-1,2-mannosidase
MMKRAINRRSFLKTAAGSGVALAGARRGFWAFGKPQKPLTPQLTQWVDVFLGTGGHGHTFPGATLPFGMVQLSPDTGTSGWDHCSGYHRDDRTILGFSHTHLSGTGVGDMMDFLLMPARGPVHTTAGDAESPGSGYRARFSHHDETAEPGYYSVLLKDLGIKAELTATTRVGMHRYHFPADKSSHFVIDLAHGFVDTPDDLPTKTGTSKVLSSELHVIRDNTVTGGRRCAQWADGRFIYFAMQFSRPFAGSTIIADGTRLSADVRDAQGKSIQCVLHCPLEQAGSILVKVGISAVSVEGAMRNLEAEIPGWEFDAVRDAARNAWESELARVKIETADANYRKTFYTAMYHALLAPTTFCDVDGQYRGMDLKIHTLPEGANNYTTYSLWDTYRALHPMYTLVQRERVPEMINSLIRMAEQSPEGVPVWPLQGVETGCMIGYHSAAVIAEAHAKGIPGVDYAHAYQLWRQRAMIDQYRGLPSYRALGFVPCDREPEAVSKTLEYAYDDWAMAHLAAAAGQAEDQELLRARSRNYKNVFDSSMGFVRGRMEDGSWASPFDPRGMGHSKQWRDFTESNSWEATFLNQHDVTEYLTLFGGDEPFVRKLDELFNQSSELPPDAPPDISGMAGQYSQGNEPDHHVAYLYAYAGVPYKTQSRVRALMTEMYTDAPDGLCGNEDCGQMSAWYIMSALGIYPVDPISGNYVFGSPLFDTAVLELGNSKTLTIHARGNGVGAPYVQTVEWNGTPFSRSWIHHEQLMGGGTLVFHMGGSPNHAFGSALEDRPPSFV